MTRWPIRIRLTAGFAVVMALVLAGVALGTVMSFRAAFDESIDSAQAERLHTLTAPPPGSGPAAARSAADTETITQILDPTTGAVLAGPEPGGGALLSAGEVAAARAGLLRAQHDTAAGLAGPVRLLAAPTPDRRGVAVVASSLAGRDGAVGDLAGELALALPLVLLVAVGGAYLIAAAALRPVERLRARAATITLADPRLPVPPAHDEIARLAVTLNELLGRQHDALVRERRFVADASHELRTPLGLLTTELELALRRPRTGAELTAALRSALEETDRLSQLAQDLLLLARLDQPDPTAAPPPPALVIALRPLLDSVLARYRHTPGEPTMILDCPEDLAVRADPGDCDRAVSNLLDNALTHGAPPILLRAWQSSPTPNSDGANHGGAPPVVQIEVRDHGPGFEPEFLPRAFDRFARADDARTGGGTGLGLAITAALADRQGGHVAAINYPDGGTGVILTFPAVPAAVPG